MALGYEERMLREVARLKEAMADLDREIQEGQSNRVSDGFLPPEATKYAVDILDNFHDAQASQKAIMDALCTAVVGMVGAEMSVNKIGGLVGNTRLMPIEQKELGIQILPAPGPIEGDT